MKEKGAKYRKDLRGPMWIMIGVAFMAAVIVVVISSLIIMHMSEVQHYAESNNRQIERFNSRPEEERKDFIKTIGSLGVKMVLENELFGKAKELTFVDEYKIEPFPTRPANWRVTARLIALGVLMAIVNILVMALYSRYRDKSYRWHQMGLKHLTGWIWLILMLPLGFLPMTISLLGVLKNVLIKWYRDRHAELIARKDRDYDCTDLRSNLKGWLLKFSFVTLVPLGITLAHYKFQGWSPGIWRDILVSWTLVVNAAMTLDYYTTVSKADHWLADLPLLHRWIAWVYLIPMLPLGLVPLIWSRIAWARWKNYLQNKPEL